MRTHESTSAASPVGECQLEVELAREGTAWEVSSFKVRCVDGTAYDVPRRAWHRAAGVKVFAAALALLKVRSGQGNVAPVLDARRSTQERDLVKSLRNIYYSTRQKWLRDVLGGNPPWSTWSHSPLEHMFELRGSEQHRTAQFVTPTLAEAVSFRMGRSHVASAQLRRFVRDCFGVSDTKRNEHARPARRPLARRHDLSGTWYGCWQTSVDHQENINSERLVLKQHGTSVKIENVARSRENTSGGYLWVAEMKLYETRQLLGVYRAREPNKADWGTLYLLVNRNMEFMEGRWVGCNYDSEFISGYGALARSETLARERLLRLCKRRPDEAYLKRKTHDEFYPNRYDREQPRRG